VEWNPALEPQRRQHGEIRQRRRLLIEGADPAQNLNGLHPGVCLCGRFGQERLECLAHSWHCIRILAHGAPSMLSLFICTSGAGPLRPYGARKLGTCLAVVS
jgi:hypothetical protein